MPASIRRLPTIARIVYWRLRQYSETRRLAAMSPAEVFGEVYQRNVWGPEGDGFDSGSGSDDYFGTPYCDALSATLDVKPRDTILDLGCGDFRIGAKLLERVNARYVGVDVVPALVDRLREKHGRDGVEFRCLDIVSQPLPEGDICLIRQVFQHLSNDEIAAVLTKLGGYDRVFVTEHFPADDAGAIPNVDTVHGGETRLRMGSAVYLDKPPFSLAVSELLCVDVPRSLGGGRLRTLELSP